jgi:magnesium chelatase subunit D
VASLEAQTPAALPAVLLKPWDLREKVRETKTGSLVLFVVDASGSMAAQRRMVAVKGAVRSLLIDAYQRRDKVGLISFRGAGAEVLLPPTGSVELAETHLAQMPTGGRTPLSHGLYLALQVVERERHDNREALPFVVLLSDGRANVPLNGPVGRPHEAGPAGHDGTGEAPGSAAAEVTQVASLFRDRHVPSLVVDTETGALRFGLARRVAEALGASYIKLEDLRADNLVHAVRLRLPPDN